MVGPCPLMEKVSWTLNKSNQINIKNITTLKIIGYSFKIYNIFWIEKIWAFGHRTNSTGYQNIISSYKSRILEGEFFFSFP